MADKAKAERQKVMLTEKQSEALKAIASEQLGTPIFHENCSTLDFAYYSKGFEIV